MKNYFFFFSVYLFLSGCASAQPGFVSTNIGGKMYYQHIVDHGNTLFAISQQYAVSVEDIIAANPGSEEGLKVGQKLLIPVDKVNRKELKKERPEVEGEFLIHKVKRKETLFALSKKYKVDVNSILEANPEANTGLKVDMEIKIPVSAIREVEEEYVVPATRDSLILHTVIAGETIYSIARMYNVSQDSLKLVNNNFPLGIKAGMTIRLPKVSQKFMEEQGFTEVVEEDSMTFAGSAEVYNIALMLPFLIDENDSLLRTTYKIIDPELHVLTGIALDYYRGTRLALDSLQKSGLRANIYVFDIGEDVVDARQVLKQPEMKNVHMIIGPMHKAPMAVISDYAAANQIPIISPNSLSGSVLDENPYKISPEAGEKVQLEFLAREVIRRHNADNVLLINSQRSGDYKYRSFFKKVYQEGRDSLNQRPLPEISLSSRGIESLRNSLSTTRKNILVVPSAELAFVSDFMTRLSQLGDKYQIIIYGLNDWIKYENIDSRYKEKFHLRIPAGSFIDFEDEEVIDFLQTYRNRYQTEPGSYGFGFVGYDIAMIFGKALMQFGPAFPKHIGQQLLEGIQANYKIMPSSNGRGYENTSVFLLEYGNYNLKVLN